VNLSFAETFGGVGTEDAEGDALEDGGEDDDDEVVVVDTVGGVKVVGTGALFQKYPYPVKGHIA
jgi:hypothetical protein